MLFRDKNNENNNKNDSEYIKRLLEQEQNELERKRRDEELMEKVMLKRFLEEEKIKKDLELENKRYTCEICFSDDLPLDKIYTLDDCHHRFCKECLTQHFKSKIFDGDCKSIQCPDTTCRRLVNYQEIKHNVDKKTMAKYEDFLLQITLKEDPNSRFCPRPGCNNAMIGDSDTVTMVICTSESCRYTFCFNCKSEWHQDMTCQQWEEFKILKETSNQRFEEWARQNTKPCPKCKSKIEKNGGCNHMTCKLCKHQFCWLCLDVYTKAHFTGGKCKQFS
ncbi:hypothetical protein ACTFIU_005414 [Dictyostelium citrinum]